MRHELAGERNMPDVLGLQEKLTTQVRVKVPHVFALCDRMTRHLVSNVVTSCSFSVLCAREDGKSTIIQRF